MLIKIVPDTRLPRNFTLFDNAKGGDVMFSSLHRHSRVDRLGASEVHVCRLHPRPDPRQDAVRV